MDGRCGCYIRDRRAAPAGNIINLDGREVTDERFRLNTCKVGELRPREGFRKPRTAKRGERDMAKGPIPTEGDIKKYAIWNLDPTQQMDAMIAINWFCNPGRSF